MVAWAIYDFLVEHELTNQPLYVAGCDSCHVNTRPNGGVIHHLEMLLVRPLHYSICQLHSNELSGNILLLPWQTQWSGKLVRNDWSADKRASVRPSCHWLPANHLFWLSGSVRGRGKLLLFDLHVFVLTLLSLSIAYLTKLFISYVCFL